MEKVSLEIMGNSCTISNGIITMMWKENATLGYLRKNGVELICNLPERSDTDGKSAFYVDYYAEGAFRNCADPKLKVIEEKAEMVHIAYIDTTWYLAIEFHIILMQGESGYYSYVIAANNTDAPFELAEFRIVYRCGNRVFDHAYNAERHGLQPTSKYMHQYEKLQDETYRLPDGEKYTNGDVYSKYDYAGFFSRNPMWGQYGHGYGFFIMPISTEYYQGGPLKQELLVHYDGIVLNYMAGSHFGNGSFHVPIGWKKIYGPLYQYFNEAENPEDLFKDALEVEKREKEKWPYQWVNEELYPLVRSKVEGKLVFEDGTPCKNTMVILGQNDLPIEMQSSGYIYYAKTDENGCFTLNNVRFDEYTLFAYQTGGSNTNELKVGGIKICKKEQILGNIVWQLPSEKILWQIGKATRTCEGYKYAGELRNYKWMTMIPDTLHFYVGKSKESEEWYYAQNNKDSWYIHFQLNELPKSECNLIIAIAGLARRCPEDRELQSMSVSLNGEEIQKKTFVNDGSVYRSATLCGRYRCMKILLKPDILKKGENVIQLKLKNCIAMYDTILLTENI